MKAAVLGCCLGLTVALGGSAAAAAVVTVSTTGCPPTQHQLPDAFGFEIQGAVVNCNDDPRINSERFFASNGLNSASHIHRAIYSTVPPREPAFEHEFTIESTPTLLPGGWFMDVSLDGFAAPQGNPDDEFTYFVRMQSTYQGVTIFTEDSGVASGGAHAPIKGYASYNCLGCAVGGPFISKLTIRIGGIGELHLSNSGIADLAGVPEPSTWALALAGVGLVGWRLRRRTLRMCL